MYDCAVGFAQHGHQVKVLSILGEHSTLPEREKLVVANAQDIAIHRFKVLSYHHVSQDPLADPTIPVDFYKNSAPLWTNLLQEVDILCTFGATPAITGGMIKRVNHTPLVVVLPGIPEESDARFEEVRQCGADVFVSVSQFMRDRSKKLYDMDMINIYNAIDTEFFKPSYRPLDYPFLKNLPGELIISPVRLDPSKGITVSIDAFEIVHRVFPEATLLITGNGSICHELGMTNPYYEYLLGIVREKRLDHRVIFAKGAVTPEDMPSLYTKAGVSMMTSLSEGWGLGNAEALACETPVVSTRTEGMQEVFIDGVGGYYADVGAADQVAEHLVKLLGDPKLRVQMGKLGRQHIMETFPLKRQTNSYLEIFERLLCSSKR
jgi:glycosyltransferase involved in cell wall biosynthesis